MTYIRYLIFILLASLFISSCSSDPETPLGSEFIGDLLGSEPGSIFKDVVYIPSGDTTVHVSSTIPRSFSLLLGIEAGYQTTPILKVDFSDSDQVSSLVVEGAVLRLRLTEETQTVIWAKFYEMLVEFSEEDTLKSIEYSTDPIPDESGTEVAREMKFLGSYNLPPALVQAWIREEADNNGFVIVADDTTSEKQLVFVSREDFENTPFLEVNFQGGIQRSYNLSEDATFVDSLQTSSNLVLSDGFTRRLYLPLDLSGIREDAIIHNAEVQLTFVPDTDLGATFNLLIYVPDSTDPDDPGFMNGTGVTKVSADPFTDLVTFSVRNIILLFLAGAVENNGFVIQYANEGLGLKQLVFYKSSADSALRPQVQMTYSSPPVFE